MRTRTASSLNPHPQSPFSSSRMPLHKLHLTSHHQTLSNTRNTPRRQTLTMTTDVFRRIGRGGAGNFYSQKDVQDAAEKASHPPPILLRKPPILTNPSHNRTKTSKPKHPPPQPPTPSPAQPPPPPPQPLPHQATPAPAAAAQGTSPSPTPLTPPPPPPLSRHQSPILKTLKPPPRRNVPKQRLLLRLAWRRGRRLAVGG